MTPNKQKLTKGMLTEADAEMSKHFVEMADRIEELEAKLAKAELIVRIIASDKWNERLGEVVDLSCEYLAELTGGKDG